MIQTKNLNCPSCGAELLDPIYDLEMVDGGRRRLTCGECGRPFTVEASLVYDVTADGEPSGTPAADAVLAAFHLADGSALRVGSRGRLVHGDGSPSGLTFEVVVDDATDLPCMVVTDGGETARASILGLTMRGWRFAGLGDGEARP